MRACAASSLRLITAGTSSCSRGRRSRRSTSGDLAATRFAAIQPGDPFFFKLKAPYNAIGGFGLFARFVVLPVWHAWDVFGQANGTRDEWELLERLDRLGGRVRPGEGLNRPIGCIAVTEPVFFAPDEWVATPADWSRNIVSGRTYDLSAGEGRRVWNDCLERAAARTPGGPVWPAEALTPNSGAGSRW